MWTVLGGNSRLDDIMRKVSDKNSAYRHLVGKMPYFWVSLSLSDKEWLSVTPRRSNTPYLIYEIQLWQIVQCLIYWLHRWTVSGVLPHFRNLAMAITVHFCGHLLTFHWRNVFTSSAVSPGLVVLLFVRDTDLTHSKTTEAFPHLLNVTVTTVGVTMSQSLTTYWSNALPYLLTISVTKSVAFGLVVFISLCMVCITYCERKEKFREWKLLCNDIFFPHPETACVFFMGKKMLLLGPMWVLCEQRPQYK